MHPLLEWLRKILPTPIVPVPATAPESVQVVTDLSYVPDEFLEPEPDGTRQALNFDDESMAAYAAEQAVLQAQFEAELEKLANTPSGQVWIWHPEFRGFHEVVLGPFINEDQAKQYLANKRAQQRGNHQEYFSSNPGAPPRHGGDLFVMPDAEFLFVGYEDFARVKMREILAVRKGNGWDHNAWEAGQAGEKQVW